MVFSGGWGSDIVFDVQGISKSFRSFFASITNGPQKGITDDRGCSIKMWAALLTPIMIARISRRVILRKHSYEMDLRWTIDMS